MHRRLDCKLLRVERRSTLPPLIELFGQEREKKRSASRDFVTGSSPADSAGNNDLGGFLFDAGYFCQVYPAVRCNSPLSSQAGCPTRHNFKLCQVLADAFIALGDFA